MELNVRLQGFKELAEGLRQLPDKLAQQSLRASTLAGAAEIRVEARKNALAIRRTGTLARSIYQKHIPELSDKEHETVFVGARQGKRYQKVGKKQVNKDAYYARFVELGHFTRPQGGGALARNTNRGERNNARLAAQVQSGKVKWVPAQPFLRPAFDAKSARAVIVIGEKLAIGLLSEADKINLATGRG